MANPLKSMTLEQIQFICTELKDMEGRLYGLCDIVGPCFGANWCDNFWKAGVKFHSEWRRTGDKFMAEANSADLSAFRKWLDGVTDKTLAVGVKSPHRLKPMSKETMKEVYDELDAMQNRLSVIATTVGPCFGATMMDRFLKLSREQVWRLADRLGIAWLENHGLSGVWTTQINLADLP